MNNKDYDSKFLKSFDKEYPARAVEDNCDNDKTDKQETGFFSLGKRKRPGDDVQFMAVYAGPEMMSKTEYVPLNSETDEMTIEARMSQPTPPSMMMVYAGPEVFKSKVHSFDNNSDSKQCSNCRAVSSKSARFCNVCGWKFTDEA